MNKEPPFWFDGVVLAVRGTDLVEISGGSDMGLRNGHKLEIVPMGGGSNAYVGRIEIIKTEATGDRGTGRQKDAQEPRAAR